MDCPEGSGHLMQHPGDCELGGGDAFAGRELFDLVN
jgi:hypothetical protein